jgi:transposase
MLNLEEWMDVKDLHRQGLSIRRISEITGYSRNTVRRKLRDKTPIAFASSDRRSQLDPYKAYITSRFNECGLLGVRLLEEIRPMGYIGSVDVVRRYSSEAASREHGFPKGHGPLRDTAWPTGPSRLGVLWALSECQRDGTVKLTCGRNIRSENVCSRLRHEA